jgi:allantoinase
MSAWGGVSGLGLGLSLLWTELGSKLGIGRVVELLGSCQAKQVGIDDRKGALIVGLDADFVIFDPTAEFEVTEVSLLTSMLTPRGHYSSRTRSRRT